MNITTDTYTTADSGKGLSYLGLEKMLAVFDEPEPTYVPPGSVILVSIRGEAALRGLEAGSPALNGARVRRCDILPDGVDVVVIKTHPVEFQFQFMPSEFKASADAAWRYSNPDFVQWPVFGQTLPMPRVRGSLRRFRKRIKLAGYRRRLLEKHPDSDRLRRRVAKDWGWIGRSIAEDK